jgi:hypothetical protein
LLLYFELIAANPVSICGQLRLGHKISLDADDWFSRFLSKRVVRVNEDSSQPPRKSNRVDCTLMRCADQPSPKQPPPTADHQSGVAEQKSAVPAIKDKQDEKGGSVGFANTAQFLVLSLESIKALTNVSTATVSNIIVFITDKYSRMFVCCCC